jgi:hypothetical protein
VIPANFVIVKDTIAQIQADYDVTGDTDSLARTDLENCWGQPITTIVVTVGLPSNVHVVTVISPGPFGMIGNASKTVKIRTK